MSAPSSPVSRCIAVAGHGRRCQQSTFRGSPYCWHHLQSRKIPAPSRLRPGTPTVTVNRTDTPLPSIEPMTAAARLARELDVDTLAALVAFVETDRDGSIVLRRRNGSVQIDSTDTDHRMPPQQARAI